MISEPDFITLNTEYELGVYKLLGELHIYSDKTPMKFIPSSNNFNNEDYEDYGDSEDDEDDGDSEDDEDDGDGEDDEDDGDGEDD